MNLFDYMKETTMEKESPPGVADASEDAGRGGGTGAYHRERLPSLYRAIKADKLSSIIFYGPPGTGKTTLARVIANTTQRRVPPAECDHRGQEGYGGGGETGTGSDGNVREKRRFCSSMRFTVSIRDSRIICFRLWKTERVILIGATTENPYFEVNGALLSRSVIFELKPLDKKDIATLLIRAVSDRERGLGAYDVVLEDDAREFLADIAGGDARAALNAVELGVLSTERSADGKIHIDLETASECIQKRAGAL